MAALGSISFLRSCGATTIRAFGASSLKAAPKAVAFAPFNPQRHSPPLPSRRLISHVRATSNEEDASKAAAATADSGAPTIFDKIINKEIPSTIVYEDDKVLAFRDISPQAPVHILVVPKLRDGLTQLGKAEERHVDILGQLLHAAKIVAEKEGILDGFRVVINNGPDACQSVYHLHLHVLGGRQMKWPPG
ncbi:hypothetical protein SAY86_018452 [Trapa natans]|uniref:HIT domain-containing protein n=1 Tax=Trapa natans TaxID=22666 RepID=A0AAN7QY29_TRANT|nr:hypothetical protein SAY86_018452 [Trapa natans]